MGLDLQSVSVAAVPSDEPENLTIIIEEPTIEVYVDW